MSNLYWIVDEKGQRVKFVPNVTQEMLFHALHYLNEILKARQLGCTTFIDIFMLDECLFHSNTSAGIIAHNLEDVKKIFRAKIKFPYDNLPDWLRAKRTLVTDSKTGLDFNNNSSIYVGTSMRSGTLQYLHVSEHGKICARFPDKAEELRTGALNTVHAGQVVFIESTAEGRVGDFYTMCQEAKKRTAMIDQRPLSPMEFKFHFFPWWIDPRYARNPSEAVIPQHLDAYFAKLDRKEGIVLTPEQRAWYALKYQTQKGKMKQEYPSTPDEAFELSLEGVIFEDELTQAYEEERIGGNLYEPELPVNTFWDIGTKDATSIVFAQEGLGELRLIDYWEGSNVGLDGAVRIIEEKAKTIGYSYGAHVCPHDSKVRDWTRKGKTRVEVALEVYGIKLETAKSPATKKAGEEAIREIFPIIRIGDSDEVQIKDEWVTGRLLTCLSSYRRAYEEKMGNLTLKPVHDWASHGADAVQTMALWFQEHGCLCPERCLSWW